jgi:type IV pilus assembly protein PilE
LSSIGENLNKINVKQKGITLLELMIVVAIIGILAGIAYPSYQSSVMQSRRAEAHTSLFALKLAMEKARGNCKYYAGAIGTSNSCGSSASASQVSFTDQSDYYNFSITSPSSSEYTLVATAVSPQTGDTSCAKITLKRDGTQSGLTSGGAISSDCW